MRYTAWSPDEIETAIRLKAEGKTYKAIGRLIGRSERQVWRRLVESRREKPETPKPVRVTLTRKCLNCKGTFITDSRFVRLCSPCKMHEKYGGIC